MRRPNSVRIPEPYPITYHTNMPCRSEPPITRGWPANPCSFRGNGQDTSRRLSFPRPSRNCRKKRTDAQRAKEADRVAFRDAAYPNQLGGSKQEYPKYYKQHIHALHRLPNTTKGQPRLSRAKCPYSGQREQLRPRLHVKPFIKKGL